MPKKKSLPEDAKRKIKKKLDISAKLEGVKEVLKCVFYIMNTLLTVKSIFLVLTGTLAFLSSMGYSKASDKNAVPGLKFLLVSGARMFGIASISVGFLQFLVAVLGCVGMTKDAVGILKAVGILSIILAVLNLVITGYVGYCLQQMHSPDGFQKQLIDTVHRYDGQDNFNTYFIDYAQVKLSCCGILDEEEFQRSRWYAAGNTELPRSCCQLKTRQRIDQYSYDTRALTSDDLMDPSCSTAPKSKAFTTVPCFTKIKNMTLGTYSSAIAAAISSMILQVGIAFIVFAKRQQASSPKRKKSSKVPTAEPATTPSRQPSRSPSRTASRTSSIASSRSASMAPSRSSSRVKI